VFLRAVETGNGERAIKLLAKGADVNARTAVGLTALHVASANGDIGLVGLLLRHGASPNEESFGGTPLHFAAMNGHRRVVDALLLHGADPFRPDPEGRTAAEIAADDDIRAIIRCEMRRVQQELARIAGATGG